MKDIAIGVDGDLLWRSKNVLAYKKYGNANLILNGMFDTDSDWQNDPMGDDPSYIEDGHAIVGGEFWQELELEEGVKYEVSFTVSDLPAGEIALFYVKYIVGVDIFHSFNAGNGGNTTSFVSPYSGLMEVNFYRSVSGVIYQLDNVSMREVVDLETESDIDWTDSAFSNMKDLLDAAPNEYKQYPFIGLNAKKYRNAPIVIQDVQRDLRLQLQLDNWDTKSATAKINNDGLLEIDINAKIV